MHVELTWLHWFYLLFVILVVISMFYRKDTAVLCTLGIFFLGLVTTGSFFQALEAIFSSFLYTFQQLLSLILVISVIVAMANVLNRSGVNEALVVPFSKLIRNPDLGFWVIGLTLYLFSLFFWPSPACALIGMFLLPAAVRAGLSPMAVAISMNLFGHGFALSGDYVIQGTPKISADGAKIPIGDVMNASIPLVIIMGIVTTILAFLFIRRDMKKGTLTLETGITEPNMLEGMLQGEKQSTKLTWVQKGLAVVVAFFFALNVVAMVVLNLQGDKATALIMGVSILLMILVSFVHDRKTALEQTTQNLIDGFQFAFRVFTPVIPIASFFYLGGTLFFDIFGKVLPHGSQGFIYDLGLALSQATSVGPGMGAIVVTAIGIISGLDGSGYSGMALIGQISHIFASGIQANVAYLSALGQIAAIWVGGGTVVPWALLPAAAICGVDPLEVARRNLIPVTIGLVVTTLAAILLLAF